MARRKIYHNRIYNSQIRSAQACTTVTIDADTLTAIVGNQVTLTAKVDPPGTYSVNFKTGGTTLNSTPIPTDSNGIATLVLDSTGQTPGLYDLTAEAISSDIPPTSCTSSPITVALTPTNVCSSIAITSPSSPFTAYIGDMVHVSISATVTESCVVELRDITSGMRLASCVIGPSPGTCTIDVDTTGAPPGTYSVSAYIGYGTGPTPMPTPQCISDPVVVTLQARPGSILVVSIPPGAKIYLDGTDKGLNSSAIISNISPSPDTHAIKLTLDGFNDYIQTNISVGSGEIVFVFALLQPTVPPTGIGILNVTSVPDGVEFGLDSGQNGTTPTTITDVPAGIRVYESGLSGYTGAIGSIEIKDGQTSNLNIPLIPSSPDLGMVLIESIPMEADIFIGGTDIGAKTSFATFLAPGPHTYELRKPGYQSKSGSFIVVTGESAPAIISETLQPVAAQAGFGTAGTILIAGLAVGAIYLITIPKTLPVLSTKE